MAPTSPLPREQLRVSLGVFQGRGPSTADTWGRHPLDSKSDPVLDTSATQPRPPGAPDPGSCPSHSGTCPSACSLFGPGLLATLPRVCLGDQVTTHLHRVRYVPPASLPAPEATRSGRCRGSAGPPDFKSSLYITCSIEKALHLGARGPGFTDHERTIHGEPIFLRCCFPDVRPIVCRMRPPRRAALP